MNYCLIDESDPADYFECEGAVLKTFFKSSKLFNVRQNLELIHTNKNIEESIVKHNSQYFNIIQFSAHGFYRTGTKSTLFTSGMVKRRNGKDVYFDPIQSCVPD
jgi:hypothetical protein